MDVENRSHEAARTLGCSGAAVEDMMRCLQSQPIENILSLYSVNILSLECLITYRIYIIVNTFFSLLII